MTYPFSVNYNGGHEVRVPFGTVYDAGQHFRERGQLISDIHRGLSLREAVERANLRHRGRVVLSPTSLCVQVEIAINNAKSHASEAKLEVHRRSDVTNLGRDKFVGIEKNPGPQGKDRRRKPNAQNQRRVADFLADCARREQAGKLDEHRKKVRDDVANHIKHADEHRKRAEGAAERLRDERDRRVRQGQQDYIDDELGQFDAILETAVALIDQCAGEGDKPDEAGQQAAVAPAADAPKVVVNPTEPDIIVECPTEKGGDPWSLACQEPGRLPDIRARYQTYDCYFRATLNADGKAIILDPAEKKSPNHQGWWVIIHNDADDSEHEVWVNAAHVRRLCDIGFRLTREDLQDMLFKNSMGNLYEDVVENMVNDAYYAIAIKALFGGQAGTYTGHYLEPAISTYAELEDAWRLKWRGPAKDYRAATLVPYNESALVMGINRSEVMKMMRKRFSARLRIEVYNKFKNSDSMKRIVGFLKREGGNRQKCTWKLEDIRPYALDLIQRKGLTAGEAQSLIHWVDFAEEKGASNLDSLIAEVQSRPLNIFVKDETYPKDSTTLRGIVSPHPLIKLIFGSVFRKVEEILYEIPEMKSHHIKHQTPEVIMEKLRALDPTPEERRRGMKVVETDYAGFEGSIVGPILETEYDIYLSYYEKDSVPWKIIDAIKQRNIGKLKLTNKKFDVLTTGQRLSGMPNTACGNLLVNWLNLFGICGFEFKGRNSVRCIQEGDDNIMLLDAQQRKTLVERSLFETTYEEADSFTDLSFCGYHYSADGVRIEPTREEFYNKIFVYFVPPTGDYSPAHKKELLYYRLMSASLLYPGCPYIDDCVDMANRCYCNVPLRIDPKFLDAWKRQHWWQIENRWGQKVLQFPVPLGRDIPHMQQLSAQLKPLGQYPMLATDFVRLCEQKDTVLAARAQFGGMEELAEMVAEPLVEAKKPLSFKDKFGVFVALLFASWWFVLALHPYSEYGCKARVYMAAFSLFLSYLAYDKIKGRGKPLRDKMLWVADVFRYKRKLQKLKDNYARDGRVNFQQAVDVMRAKQRVYRSQHLYNNFNDAAILSKSGKTYADQEWSRRVGEAHNWTLNGCQCGNEKPAWVKTQLFGATKRRWFG